MTALFLSSEEREALTGYSRLSKQAEWLRSHGITFWVNAKGEPVVPTSAIEGKAKPRWEPKVSPG